MFAFLLLACNELPIDDEYPATISPAAGQTLVGSTQPLRVERPFDYPQDFPLPDVIRVVRAEAVDPSDAWIPGELELTDAGTLQFMPAEPWEADTTYVWTVREPLADTRRPQLDVPEQALGTAEFTTSGRVDVLAAGWDGPGRLCAVLSRPIDATIVDELRLTVDDEPVPIALLELLDDDALQGGHHVDDQGLAAICLGTSLVSDGERARIWVGDRPWLFELGDVSPQELALALRRAP